MAPEIIIALDLPGQDARRLLDQIPDVRWVKVGSILYAREGPALIRDLVGRGVRVFLDLKWHDIPNTVSEAVAAASEMGIAMATVHTLGGMAMMTAAAGAAGTGLGLVGVTVLTSHTAESYSAALGRAQVALSDEVVRLTTDALRAGLRGVVCSPLEAATIRRLTGPGTWIVVAGIRRPGDPPGDQARTATPSEAARAGASHLVVGRPILRAARPAEVFRELTEDAS